MLQKYSKSFRKVLTNTCFLQYNKILLRRSTSNYISSQNFFWGVRLCTVHACGMRKGNAAAAIAALNCRRRSSVKDSFDFEFQSRLHHCETKTARDKSILLYWSVHIDVPAFFAAQMPVTIERPAEWDMILRQPLFSESERNNAA